MDDLLAAVHDKKHEFQQKQWTVERGAGKDAFVLRDVFTKIATWVENFVACGDCAVQYDPGHAALPWPAVRFLLKVEAYPKSHKRLAFLMLLVIGLCLGRAAIRDYP